MKSRRFHYIKAGAVIVALGALTFFIFTRTVGTRREPSASTAPPPAAQAPAQAAVQPAAARPGCPPQTDDLKLILACPGLPDALIKVLKAQNYESQKGDCDSSSRTTNFMLGPRYISWTRQEMHDCLGTAHPDGRTQEETFDLKTGQKVSFSEEFKVDELEKYFLTHVDVKSATLDDGSGRRCGEDFDEQTRTKPLGGLRSELTAAEYRFVDKGGEVFLQMFAREQGYANRGCVLRYQFKEGEWKPLLRTK